MAAIDVSARAPGASASRLTKAAAAAAAGIRIIPRPSLAPDSTAVQARRASEKSGTPRFSVDHPSADRLPMSRQGDAMGEHVLRDVKLGLVVLALSVGAALAAPVNSDLATAQLGGGCYPTGINPAVLHMLVLVNPEWSPLMNGMTVASTPITVHGTVQGMHGDTSGDFPATHVRADVNHFVLPDAADADGPPTGNDDLHPHFEWERRS